MIRRDFLLIHFTQLVGHHSSMYIDQMIVICDSHKIIFTKKTRWSEYFVSFKVDTNKFCTEGLNEKIHCERIIYYVLSLLIFHNERVWHVMRAMTELYRWTEPFVCFFFLKALLVNSKVHNKYMCLSYLKCILIDAFFLNTTLVMHHFFPIIIMNIIIFFQGFI